MSNGAEWLRPKFSANAGDMGPSLRWDDKVFWVLLDRDAMV